MNVRDLIKELGEINPGLDVVFEQGKMLIVSDTHSTPPVIIEHPKVIFDCHLHTKDKLDIIEGKFGVTL